MFLAPLDRVYRLAVPALCSASRRSTSVVIPVYSELSPQRSMYTKYRGWLLRLDIGVAYNNAMEKTNEDSFTERATFAGGCFWCVQGPFDAEAGVTDVRVGYIGGSREQASYQVVASGASGHREGVDMRFDPALISFKDLCEIFWRQIDPTDPGGQFADRGPQYMTAIYYHSEEQRSVAEETKRSLASSGKFAEPIATEVLPFVSFFEAEEEHQSYYKKNPLRYKMYKRGSGRASFLQRNWNR